MTRYLNLPELNLNLKLSSLAATLEMLSQQHMGSSDCISEYRILFISR